MMSSPVTHHLFFYCDQRSFPTLYYSASIYIHKLDENARLTELFLLLKKNSLSKIENVQCVNIKQDLD